jgi:hypothetical protein
VPVARTISSAPQVPLPGKRPAGLSRSLALRALALLIASAVVAGGAATLLSRSSSPPAPAAPQPAHSVVPEIHAVPASEASAFAILRQPQRAGDIFRQIRAGAGPLGADPKLARTALAPVAPSVIVPRLVSVVPARGAVCLRILETVSAAQWWCLPTAQAARGQLIVALLPPAPKPVAASTQYVIGLVPDGVSNVTIRSVGGIGHKVTVRRNVYAGAVFEPDRITFKLPGRGTVSYAVRD